MLIWNASNIKSASTCCKSVGLQRDHAIKKNPFLSDLSKIRIQSESLILK